MMIYKIVIVILFEHLSYKVIISSPYSCIKSKLRLGVDGVVVCDR